MKFLVPLFLSLLLFSCGTGFHSARYSKRQWARQTSQPSTAFSTDSITDARILAKAEVIPANITDPAPASEAGFQAGTKEIDRTTSAPAPLEKRVLSPRKPVTERSIRAKGFASIGVGALSAGSFAYGFVLFLGGLLSGYLFFLAAGLLAYLGMKIALSSKRDIDTLTNRSTLAWLNRPATVGFVFNVSILIAVGLMILLLLVAFI